MKKDNYKEASKVLNEFITEELDLDDNDDFILRMLIGNLVQSSMVGIDDLVIKYNSLNNNAKQEFKNRILDL